MIEAIGLILFEKGKSLLGFAVFFILLERAFPSRKSQKILRKGFRLDLTYSFLLVLIFYPVQVVCMPMVVNYFYGAIGLPDDQVKGQVQTTVLQDASHGKVAVQPDGTIQYRTETKFSGFDRFVIRKSDGENHLTQTLMARMDTPAEEEGALPLKTAQPKVSLFVTSSVPGGKVTEGFTGQVLKARTLILQQSIWLQILIAVFLIDFVGYWRHRFMHTRYLWPFHTIHHSSRQVDWLSTERFHPVNHLISASFNLVILAALFQDPYVGATAMLLRRGYGLFIHSNIPLGYGFLNYILVSPRFHRWHHSDSQVVKKKNYATFFSIFDLAFGTFYLPKEKKDPESFGFHGGELGNGLFEQLAYPFPKLTSQRKVPAIDTP